MVKSVFWYGALKVTVWPMQEPPPLHSVCLFCVCVCVCVCFWIYRRYISEMGRNRRWMLGLSEWQCLLQTQIEEKRQKKRTKAKGCFIVFSFLFGFCRLWDLGKTFFDYSDVPLTRPSLLHQPRLKNGHHCVFWVGFCQRCAFAEPEELFTLNIHYYSVLFTIIHYYSVLFSKIQYYSVLFSQIQFFGKNAHKLVRESEKWKNENYKKIDRSENHQKTRLKSLFWPVRK